MNRTGATIRAAPAAVCRLPAATGALAQAGKIQVQWLGQSATKITTPGGKVEF
jgi:hypothetical protein